MSLRKFWVVPALIFCSLLHAETIIDFSESAPAVGLHQPEKKMQSFRYAEQEAGNRALRIDWDASQARHFECNFARPFPLPEFTRAEIRVNVFIPPGFVLRSFNLRLRDADGEIWQFVHPLTKRDGGRQELVFLLDGENPQAASWGGSGNQKIDFPVSLAGFAGDFGSRSGNFWCAIEQAFIKVTSSNAPLKLELYTGNAVHVFPAGSAQPPEFRITNTKGHAVSGRIEYRLTATSNAKEFRNEESWNLAPGQTFRHALPMPEALGIYYADTVLIEDGTPDQAQKKRLSYAHMLPAGPTPGAAKGFLFGICSHPKRGTFAEQQKEALAAALCGAKVVREDINWEQLQRTPDRWNWEPFDDVVSIFGKQNMEIQAIYCYSPRWATAKDWKPVREGLNQKGNPADEHWKNFIHTFAARYRGKIRYVEAWNEPDLPGFANFSPEAYLNMMKIAYTETKATAPEMTVLSGGFAGINDHMRQTLKNGKGFYDVIAYHGHGPFPGYRAQVEALQKMRSDFDIAAPWYANETAISSLHIGEMKQAVTLYRKFLYSWARGAIGYNWYDLRNDGFDPGHNEHNFGLLTRDFYPKAAYGVYNMLSTYFQNGEFLRDADLGKNGNGFFFRDASGDILLPHWGDASQLIMYSDVSGKAFLVDLFGNEKELTINNGSVVFETTSTPATLRFAQSRQPRFAGELFRCDEEFICRPGQLAEFPLHLTNPGGEAVDFQFTVELPEGLTLARKPERIRVWPGQSKTLPLMIETAKNFRSFPGHLSELKIAVNAGKLWSGELAYPVRSVTVLSSSKVQDEPHFTLDREDQATFLAPNAPTHAHLFWKGPEDLSATIRLGHEKEELLLHVSVTDDVHYQPFRDSDVWQGDNIQFALKLPNQRGYWEIGLSRLADGASESFIWFAPAGFSTQTVANAIKLTTSRDENARTTTYSARIPFRAIGLDSATIQRGFRFNLLVNDNDGEMRESFLSIAPGLGKDKTPDAYPLILFE